MNILAIDTAGKTAAVAVMRDDTLLYEMASNTGLTHSETLLPIATDGSFGPATAEAVRIFQGQYGLTPDGIAGPVTWEAIHSRYQRLYVALQSNQAYQENSQEGATS